MPNSPPPLPISLSLEETEQLAGLARRKSNDRTVREDLRLKLAHNNVLGSLLRDIAKRSPPPSPLHHPSTPSNHDHHSHNHKSRSTIQWATQIVSKVEHVEHYDLAKDNDNDSSSSSGGGGHNNDNSSNDNNDYNDYFDDEEEDLAGLSLCRVSSRPVR